ncbi:MAG: sensor histidine kinase, partial [Candidatus Omnitrophica bacterium]|nr:sensor histidine kinase [Candidatus Omnitrophota bacterium]
DNERATLDTALDPDNAGGYALAKMLSNREWGQKVKFIFWYRYRGEKLRIRFARGLIFGWSVFFPSRMRELLDDYGFWGIKDINNILEYVMELRLKKAGERFDKEDLDHELFELSRDHGVKNRPRPKDPMLSLDIYYILATIIQTINRTWTIERQQIIHGATKIKSAVPQAWNVLRSFDLSVLQRMFTYFVNNGYIKRDQWGDDNAGLPPMNLNIQQIQLILVAGWTSLMDYFNGQIAGDDLENISGEVLVSIIRSIPDADKTRVIARVALSVHEMNFNPHLLESLVDPQLKSFLMEIINTLPEGTFDENSHVLKEGQDLNRLLARLSSLNSNEYSGESRGRSRLAKPSENFERAYAEFEDEMRNLVIVVLGNDVRRLKSIPEFKYINAITIIDGFLMKLSSELEERFYQALLNRLDGGPEDSYKREIVKNFFDMYGESLNAIWRIVKTFERSEMKKKEKILLGWIIRSLHKIEIYRVKNISLDGRGDVEPFKVAILKQHRDPMVNGIMHALKNKIAQSHGILQSIVKNVNKDPDRRKLKSWRIRSDKFGIMETYDSEMRTLDKAIRDYFNDYLIDEETMMRLVYEKLESLKLLLEQIERYLNPKRLKKLNLHIYSDTIPVGDLLKFVVPKSKLQIQILERLLGWTNKYYEYGKIQETVEAVEADVREKLQKPFYDTRNQSGYSLKLGRLNVNVRQDVPGRKYVFMFHSGLYHNLFELIYNAFKYSYPIEDKDAYRAIDVDLFMTSRGELATVVSDEGNGLTVGDIKRILRPGETSAPKDSTDGTGNGLNALIDAVQSMGGRFAILSSTKNPQGRIQVSRHGDTSFINKIYELRFISHSKTGSIFAFTLPVNTNLKIKPVKTLMNQYPPYLNFARLAGSKGWIIARAMASELGYLPIRGGFIMRAITDQLLRDEIDLKQTNEVIRRVKSYLQTKRINILVDPMR